MYVMFYEPADDSLPRPAATAPLTGRGWPSSTPAACCCWPGPWSIPGGGSAMGVFTSRQAAEEFIRGDPFVLHGVVRSWRVRTWDEFLTGPDDRTVSGDGGERGAAAAGAATGGG